MTSLSPLHVRERPSPSATVRVGAATARSPNRPAWTLAGKRMLDIVGATVLLVAFSPLLALLALWVRLDSAGPALFGHERLGAGGKRFRCFKFRTMRRNAEEQLRADPALFAQYVANDYKLPPDRDPRLTRIGWLLRRSSLDELPQLVNVLRGEMSLVGPRPIVPREVEQYGVDAELLLSVRPGITGAWAVSGRSDVEYPRRAEIELDYVRRWSLRWDLRILRLTVPTVLRCRGAS